MDRTNCLVDATIDDVASYFHVARPQAERDHLISHVLASIARSVGDHVIFFGGTALSRTWLADVRLSEDIDLIVTSNRTKVFETMNRALQKDLKRTHGRVTWDPEPLPIKGTGEIRLVVAGNLSVKMQLIAQLGYPDWPTEQAQIQQRYSDAPPASMRVLTAAAFVAAKFMAWSDRHASRDLFDLWALDRVQKVNAESRKVCETIAGLSWETLGRELERRIEQNVWESDLAHQLDLTITADEALAEVQRAHQRLS